MTEKHSKSKYQELVSRCKILFNLKGPPAFGNRDSFPFSCNEAWLEPLTNLCTKLENLNKIFYPKYGIRASVSEIKSKYGELRFYCSVLNEESKLKKILARGLEKLEELLSKIDFQVVSKTDNPGYMRHEVRELLKSEWLRANERDAMCSNVRSYELDGHYFEEVWYDVHKKTHPEPTKHKLFYYLREWCRTKSRCLECSTLDKSKESSKIADVMEDLVDYYIQDAEKECACLCERCGAKISEYQDDSKRCTTIGWVEYLCKDCAEKQNHDYMYQGALWNAKKIIKTKEQLEKKRKREDAKEAKSGEEWDKKDKVLKLKIEKAIAEENAALQRNVVKSNSKEDNI